MYKKIWPKAKHANIFIRPVTALSEEVQRRMIKRAIERLDIPHKYYVAQASGDKEDSRGLLLHQTRTSGDVIVVCRLNVLARPGDEVSTTVTKDFTFFIGELIKKADYILILDSNLVGNKPEEDNSVTSNDKEWEAVYHRAVNVASKAKDLKSKKATEMVTTRWKKKGEFKGVFDEWTKNPERADDLEVMGRIWRDPKHSNDKEAYEALPDEVRAQITSAGTARRIFGKRRPKETKYGRPKKPT